MALHYVEDWLLCLYGSLDIEGNPTRRRFTAPIASPISLANYDKRFIQSVGAAIEANQGLTDRQVLLAVKVITKYEKQWERLGANPMYLLLPDQEVPLRLPIREVNRECSITREDKTIRIVFPYNSEMISQFYNNVNESAGRWVFNKEGNRKVWELDFTEGNIHKLANMSLDKVPFEISSEMQALIQLAREDHSPRLDYVDNKLVCVDVPEIAVNAMIEYGFSPDADVFEWILLATKFGVTPTPALLEQSEMAARMVNVEKDLSTYPGTSTITWDDLDHLIETTSFNILFHYRERELKKVERDIRSRYTDCSRFAFVEASTRDFDYATINNQMMDNITLDLKKTLLLTDLIIGNPRSRTFLSTKCLGMLYMIPDDRKQNADVQTSDKG